MNERIHSCSYYCYIPACIKAQRDELRDKFVATPSTHRVVSVELLRHACNALEAWDLDTEELRAIIEDKGAT